MKLELHFQDDTDTRWAHITLKQEGMPGFTLPFTWLPEFVEALQNSKNNEHLYFYKNFFVRTDRTSCKLFISTMEHPLLHLSVDQKEKLQAHLKATFSSYL